MDATVIGIVSTVKDIVLGLTAIVGATVAVLGLGTWRRQLTGQAEYNLARRILRLCYQYRDAIAGVRHPAMWGHEMPSPPEDAKLRMPEQKQFYGVQKAYEARWEKVRSVRTELYPELLEGEVFWDKELTNLMKPLFQLERELLMAVQDLLELQNPDVHSSDKEHLQDREAAGKRRELLYARLGQEDEFESKFNASLESMSTFLKRYLKK